MDEDRSELIQHVIENSKQQPKRLTWNRFSILFEKCLFLNKSKWLILQLAFVLYISINLFAVFEIPPSSHNSSQQSANKTLSVRNSFVNLEVMVPIGFNFNYLNQNLTNKDKIDSFMNYVKKISQQ